MTDTSIEIYEGDHMMLSPADVAACNVMITDPAYSEHVHNNCASMGTAGAGPSKRELGFEPLTDAQRTHTCQLATGMDRWVVVFSDREGSHYWMRYMRSQGLEYIRDVPWVRWSQPQLTGDRPPSGCEDVNIFHAQHRGSRGGVKPMAKHWNGPGSLTHFYRRCMRGADKNKAQKPLDLMLDLVCYFSDPGELVLDHWSGRGTTAQACRLLDRSCLGLELRPDEVRKALKRISSPLDKHDTERATEWCVTVHEEASAVPYPKAADGSDVKTWERAQRRLADVERVAAWL